ncbi:hypothetical protein BJ508DRAFT_411799 [Ascobolus immersus RN42]|uniref:WSC domain-containing protein n=1 Tax=Ascobolus immersus RN42 TaxID=1160509 RepID=A0A3N4IJ01_ASCIM|nr:hypothetical protein BJ508DRAFT_411799 [Ascobolus immersus RN42]
MVCNGDVTTFCGGNGRMNVYDYNDAVTDIATPLPGTATSTTTGTSTAEPEPTVGPTDEGFEGWDSLGCYVDQIGLRTLAFGFPVAAPFTTQKCLNVCKANGYKYAGTEYGGECFCDNSFKNGGGPAPDGNAYCNMECAGAPTEICGGPNRLSVYENTEEPATTTTTGGGAGPTTTTTPPAAEPTDGWNDIGCYTDGAARALSHYEIVPGNTVEKCTAACQSGGYKYAGMEYGAECYCGNTIANGHTKATSGCDMPCAGNPEQLCGGPFRLNVWSFFDSGAPPTTTTTTSTDPEEPTPDPTATTAPGGVETGLPEGFDYYGCYIDGAQGRIMRFEQPGDPQMTVESCANRCNTLGYKVAGMQYSTQCFCDNYIQNGGTVTTEGQCNMACGGSASQKCGGPNRMNIYAKGDLETYQPPAVQDDDLPGEWEYKGCLVDDPVLRTFKYQLELAENNTATNCLSRCSEYGYGSGGMEFGKECFCGDYSEILAAGAAIRPESECNTPCTGNPEKICGGGGRISYYSWRGNLEKWNYPAGDAAGRYEFLIGGVVIPLITTPGINGKITFVEKFGTGALNTTGAYEFDPSLVPSMSAWREMTGIKTDVFCAAGLILPDKAGRQISIGGWANDATYGVRLYTPDGSPGVDGVNQWQENVNAVSLQIGRWYPTNMIMTNGSILVVGGQIGSNGAPIPNLEILPKPEGGYVKHCDYLERTDPYNLYPYLAVLPSGGIFVAYYNEARVLDPVTLDTVKELPNIPAAVNNFLGGRTYPFEGTAVLLPQLAPYSDPLRILICGGSTPGPEIAIDNCVSIAPDEPEAEWTIERMPNPRVISCMSALPDGTYLIANGALQGRAGFGTATGPNLNAVLYDPWKPLHQRMSVMANTTIPRMYHSEAQLLMDGRVLIAGSDPQDPRYDQEYRVEVFIPPYLTSGLPRPEFTIVDKDWAHNDRVEFTLTSGTAAKVSLIAADSSTHGNSMGQRTIFPEFTCTGATCSVVAPPDGKICPPSWYMMFVLSDDGVPSIATWVRIGGDPAQLGNWPDHPDFDVPGI